MSLGTHSQAVLPACAPDLAPLVAEICTPVVEISTFRAYGVAPALPTGITGPPTMFALDAVSLLARGSGMAKAGSRRAMSPRPKARCRRLPFWCCDGDPEIEADPMRTNDIVDLGGTRNLEQTGHAAARPPGPRRRALPLLAGT